MKFGVIVFPGSNCDQDCYYVLKEVMKTDIVILWHKDTIPDDLDCVVLPGGFSYGDYLRTGAIARFSPIMRSVAEFAKKGRLVIGICNGFQILLEAGLLPGAMLNNTSLKFICRWIHIRNENAETPFSRFSRKVLRIPIAHGQGNYFHHEDGIKKLRDNDQIVFRYCDESGTLSDEANPNGSIDNIAGIVNEDGNVFGMMPHPERCAEPELSSTDGRLVFESILNHLS